VVPFRATIARAVASKDDLLWSDPLVMQEPLVPRDHVIHARWRRIFGTQPSDRICVLLVCFLLINPPQSRD
jgi:hypothetical protein